MLRWGLEKDSERLVSISEVQKGKNCNCICPSCRTPLVAHKADIAHHFKHYRTEECNRGIETAIHLKAKEIIAFEKRINIPRLEASAIQDEYTEFASIPSQLIVLDNEIILEQKQGKIKPDLIVSYKGKKLLIEIAVTHFVDERKRKVIRDQGISCIEIDLRELHRKAGNVSDDELIQDIIYRLDNKKWIFNSKHAELNKKSRLRLEHKIKEERNRKSQEDERFNRWIVDSLKSNSEIIIDEDKTLEVRDGSSFVEYIFSLSICTHIKVPGTLNPFTQWVLQDLTVSVSVNQDDDSVFINSLEIADPKTGVKFISNETLEGFIETKLKSLSSQVGLHKWLNKLAKH